MRKTKKIRHQPEKEGIYLEDLNLEEMDPEVAQLYLYGNKKWVSKLFLVLLIRDQRFVFLHPYQFWPKNTTKKYAQLYVYSNKKWVFSLWWN